MEKIITKELAVKAILFGACRVPSVRKLISSFSQQDLIWAEKLLTELLTM